MSTRNTPASNSSKILLDYVVPDMPSAPSTFPMASHAQGEQVILDHRGPVRLQLQPDGSFICEPGSATQQVRTPSAAPPCSTSRPVLKFLAVTAFDLYIQAMGAFSLSLGGMAGLMALMNAEKSTPMQLFISMSETVSCATAGCFTGFLLGPLIATVQLCKVLSKPVAFAAAGAGAVLGLRNMGAAKRLVRQLNCSDVLKQLEAVGKVAVKAAKNERFREMFHIHGGMETLLKMLASSPHRESASAIANAIAKLVQHGGCRDAVVSSCGVGLVAQLLDHHDPLTIAHAVQALAHLSSHALAQEALKVQDMVPKLLSLVRGGESITYDTPQHALKALLNLAGDAANRDAMVSNGAVPLLTALLRDVSVLSEVKAIAVALLHQLARSNPDVAQALADIDDLNAILQRLLSALGPLWHPAKGDIHGLLTMLSRTPATLFGDAPVMVRPPPRLPLVASQRQSGGASTSGTKEPLSPRTEGVEGSGLQGVDYVTLSA